jgi:hydroxylamine dehydrogenase
MRGRDLAWSANAMPFKSVFMAVLLATALIVGAFLVNARRSRVERSEPTPALVEATGKCAECHRHETPAIIDQFERSQHAVKGVNCLDCHHPVEGQLAREHRGFTIAKTLTAKNCAQCHAGEYEQYARSRHAAASWAAIHGAKDFTPEQVALGERFQPGAINRTPMGIGALEGPTAVSDGCNRCHSIGRPNADGSFGTCTDCHARHSTSVALAREPTTCGQCHMGPDHSQIEIYDESKHGVLFVAQRPTMNLNVDPKKLTTADMSVPTCSTCHMSGLEGLGMTHDTSERLSWYLFAPVSTKRANYERTRAAMKGVCAKCHARSGIDDFYAKAEEVVLATNEKVRAITSVMDGLRKDGIISSVPFADPIDFDEFDAWHFYGRTAKHGAFMGGADFVQWHGNYELLRLGVKIDRAAAELRAAHAKP